MSPSVCVHTATIQSSVSTTHEKAPSACVMASKIWSICKTDMKKIRLKFPNSKSKFKIKSALGLRHAIEDLAEKKTTENGIKKLLKTAFKKTTVKKLERKKLAEPDR